MKATKRLITFTAVLALLLSMVSCSLLGGKANLTQKITAGNIEVTIRDDMKEDPTLSDEGYLKCFFWGGYGMNIASFSSSDNKWHGNSKESLLLEMVKEQEDASEIKNLGDFCYIEYTLKDDNNQYRFSNFILEEGYEYYIFEFYTTQKTSDKYINQYKDILSSVKMLEEPPKTIDTTIDGVNLTLDGDAYDIGNSFYLCGRYVVNAFFYNIADYKIDSKGYCQSLIEQNKFTTIDGQVVADIQTDDEGISSFECFFDDTYLYYYVKIVKKTTIAVSFRTSSPADDALKAEFAAIASAASLA